MNPKLTSFSYTSKQDNEKAQLCLFFLSLSFLRLVRNHDTWLSFLTKFTKKTTRMSTNTMITAHEVYLKQNKHCNARCQINFQSCPRALRLQKKHWKQHELSLYYLSHGTENTSTKFYASMRLNQFVKLFWVTISRTRETCVTIPHISNSYNLFLKKERL